MADSTVRNDDTDSNIPALMNTIDTLQQQKTKLTHQNQEMNQNIEKLTGEIEASRMSKQSLQTEIESIHLISSRANDLDNEVTRLQRELISSMTQLEEASAELDEEKSVLEALRRSDLQKSRQIEVIVRERMFLLEKIRKDSEGVKQSNSRIQELEKKIEALEMRDRGYKNNEKFRAVEEMRLRIDERDGEICDLENVVEDLREMMERSNKDRDELEIVTNELEALLKKSERRRKEMESKMGVLHMELEGSEKMISGLQDKRNCVYDGEEDGFLGLNLDWSAVVASSCFIALLAAVYLRYTR